MTNKEFYGLAVIGLVGLTFVLYFCGKKTAAWVCAVSGFTLMLYMNSI